MDQYNAAYEACINSIREAETALRDFTPAPMAVGGLQFQIIKLKRRDFRRILGIVLGAAAQLQEIDFDFSGGIEIGAIFSILAQLPALEDILIEAAVRTKDADGTARLATDAELDELDFDASLGLAVMVLTVNIIHNHALRTFGGVARIAGRLAIAEAQPETTPGGNAGAPQPEPGQPN